MKNKRKVNKYKNKKHIVNGIEFDSRKEARRFNKLLLLEKAGAIQNLQMQVKYILIPAQREPDTIGKRGGVHKGKTLERECAYIADFVYTQDGETIVEDVKGYRRGQAYAIFSLKRKLMLYVHGIRVKEV